MLIFVWGILLLILFFSLKNLISSMDFAKYRSFIWFGLLLIILLLLTFSGRMQPLIGFFSVLFLYLSRLVKTGMLLKNIKELFMPSNCSKPTGFANKMSVDEACKILGVKPDASREEIKKAYKQLMMKLHPDKGGSDYLASKLNDAKNILLQIEK